MGYYVDRNGEEWTFDPPQPDVTLTDNPVVATLLDHKGNVLAEWTERPVIGFR